MVRAYAYMMLPAAGCNPGYPLTDEPMPAFLGHDAAAAMASSEGEGAVWTRRDRVDEAMPAQLGTRRSSDNIGLI